VRVFFFPPLARMKQARARAQPSAQRPRAPTHRRSPGAAVCGMRYRPPCLPVPLLIDAESHEPRVAICFALLYRRCPLSSLPIVVVNHVVVVRYPLSLVVRRRCVAVR
jgi:hypothetical protein